jgi:hypothetical protein
VLETTRAECKAAVAVRDTLAEEKRDLEEQITALTAGKKVSDGDGLGRRPLGGLSMMKLTLVLLRHSRLSGNGSRAWWKVKPSPCRR